MLNIAKKLVSLFLLFLLLVPVSLTLAQDNDKGQEPSATESSKSADAYALFWPVVPGKTIKDSTFFLKQLKESFGEFFSFGEISKSEYQINLSEKRLVEAFKLFTEDKDFSNAFKTLDMNKQNRDKSLEYLKKTQEAKKEVKELRIRLSSSLEKQQTVIKGLLSKVPEEQKGKLSEIIEKLTLQISEAR